MAVSFITGTWGHNLHYPPFFCNFFFHTLLNIILVVNRKHNWIVKWHKLVKKSIKRERNSRFMIIWYQNYIEKCMKKNWKKGGNVGHDLMYLWVLLVEEIGVHVDNHRSTSSHHKLYHIKLYRVHLAICRIRTLVVIGTDCTGSCKSNYHMMTTTTAHFLSNIYVS